MSTLGVRLGGAWSPCSYCWGLGSSPSLEVWGLRGETGQAPKPLQTQAKQVTLGSLSAKVPGFHTLPLEPGREAWAREHDRLTGC